MRAKTSSVQLQCPLLRWLEPQVVLVQAPKLEQALPLPGVSDICYQLFPPPIEHAWSNLSHLAYIGGDAQAAPSCRILGSGSYQVWVYCAECSGSSRATVFWGVQENHQMVFSHSALLCGALEVIGAASGVCSLTPIGIRILPPLELEISVVVLPTTVNHLILLSSLRMCCTRALSCSYENI